MKQTEEKIRSIIWKACEREEKRNQIFEGEIRDIVEDLEFDSLQIINFILMIEEEFQVSFDDSEVLNEIWDFARMVQWLEALS